MVFQRYFRNPETTANLRDIYAASFVVGNSANGDTLQNSHFLDAQGVLDAVAAVAALPSGNGEIYVRAGIYDFAGLGGIVVPDAVTIRGSLGATVFATDTVYPFISNAADTFMVLGNIAIAPQGVPTAGTSIIEVGGDCRVFNIPVILDDLAAVGTLLRAWHIAGTSAISFMETLPILNGAGLAAIDGMLIEGANAELYASVIFGISGDSIVIAASSLVISDLNLLGGCSRGIYLQSGSHNNIAGVRVEGSISHGFEIEDTHGNFLTACHATSCGGDGFRTAGNRGSISNCHSNGNTGNGITALAASNNNVFSANVVHTNGGDGGNDVGTSNIWTSSQLSGNTGASLDTTGATTPEIGHNIT
ncbi:MAG: right-handed parallel beta-helix repeat-containing protein [bacterium]|nr:right-handed parallel beta-helix repeat-containing protein [bacterium]